MKQASSRMVLGKKSYAEKEFPYFRNFEHFQCQCAHTATQFAFRCLHGTCLCPTRLLELISSGYIKHCRRKQSGKRGTVLHRSFCIILQRLGKKELLTNPAFLTAINGFLWFRFRHISGLTSIHTAS